MSGGGNPGVKPEQAAGPLERWERLRAAIATRWHHTLGHPLFALPVEGAHLARVRLRIRVRGRVGLRGSGLGYRLGLGLGLGLR